MYGSRKSNRSQRRSQWTTCSSPVRSAAIFVRSSGRSCPLLFPHLRKRQSRADRDYIKDGMRWVGRQAQLVNLFPHSNANVGRIEVGTLLGQVLASLLGALIFLMCEALSGSLDEVSGTGQRHMSIEQSRQAKRLQARVQATRVTAALADFRAWQAPWWPLDYVFKTPNSYARAN